MLADVVIVGAGLSGLVAARELQRAGYGAILLDKGRSVGGRLATRRVQDGLADHGAQFFTVRTPEFQEQVDRWLADGLVRIWGHGWSDGSLKRTAGDGHPRYVTLGGMNAMARRLASELTTADIHLEVQARNVQELANEPGWLVTDVDEHGYRGRALLLTAPVPQSLALLQGVALDARTKASLDHIHYGPCLCAMVVVDGEVNLPDPGALQDQSQIIYWIADNQRKGISPQRRIITMHAEARWSQSHYDDPDETSLGYFHEVLKPYLAEGARITESQLKKWRYSVPIVTHPEDTLVLPEARLAFAGDAFGGRGRVEGAYLSGLAAGRALAEALR